MTDSFSSTTAPAPDDDPRGGLPPAGELFSSPEAKLVWGALQTLGEADLHLVFERLQQHVLIPEVRKGTHAQKIARAIGAVREAAELVRLAEGASSLGDVELTQDTYVQLRALHPDRGWPPATSLKRWVGGGWNDALRLASLEPVFDGDALVEEIGPKFTREELIEVIKQYAADCPEQIPTLRGLIMWAKRPDVLARPGRRPRSLGPFTRAFDGWADALAAAGLVQADSPTGAAQGSGWGSIRPARATGYTDEQLFAALREVHHRLRRSPKLVEYARERDKIGAEERAAGTPPRPFPSGSVIQNRFPTWDAALIAAGLPPAQGRRYPARSNGRRGGPRVTDHEVFAAICEAYAKVGDPFTVKAYQAWRKEQVKADRQARVLRSIPEYNLIWERFGTWRNAIKLARQWHDAEQRKQAGGSSVRADAGSRS